MILNLWFTFLKIGFLGFGGGYAMLSLIFEEASKFGMTIHEFADLNALDVLIPGPIAINSATYVGQMYGGFLGALASTLAVSVPSLVFVPVFLHYEERINGNRYLNAAISCVKSASVGLIFAVALSIMLSAALNVSGPLDWGHIDFDWLSSAIILVVFVLHIRYAVNPIVLTLIAGIVGWAAYFI